MKAPDPLDHAALAAHPLPPVVEGDKESKGRLLVIAGSREVPGAALLTARGAMRAGAGKLCIATSASIAGRIGVAFPEAKVVSLAEDGDALAFAAVEQIARESANAEGDVCKPIAAALLQSEARLVFDAAMLQRLEPLPPHERSTSPILLPHSGELAALLDVDREAVERDPLRCGLRAAKLYRSLVLVKGVTSHVVTPDGQAWTYDGGAPGLGVSGSGDVLAGIVAGLLARGAEPLHALLWAVWLHGEAGAALAKKIGPIGFLAREIADEVPALIPR
jgi:hydroxyethylthiazole kinase-like uncharacterized protein yjeF